MTENSELHRRQTKERAKAMKPERGKVPPTTSNEDAFWKGYRDGGGWYLAAAGVLRRTTLTRVNFACGNIALPMVAILLIPVIWKSDSLELIFESAYYSMLTLSLISGMILSCFNQERLYSLYTGLGRGLYEYDILDDQTTREIRALRAKGKREKEILIKLIAAMGLVAYIGFCFGLTMLSMISGKYFEPQKSTGIIDVQVSMWIPFKLEHGKLFWTRILLTVLSSYYSWLVITTVSGWIALDICAGHTLLYEFKVLALSIKTFERRAKWSHKEKYAGERQMFKESLRLCLKNSLKESILHHRALLGVATDYAEALRFPKLIFLVTNTAVICLSAVSLCSDIPLPVKTLFALYTIMELMDSFIICFYGQIMQDAHLWIRHAICESGWPKYTPIIGKYVLILLTRLQKPLTQTAGGFADVNLDTYTQMVKTSFSYFSLLRALE